MKQTIGMRWTPRTALVILFLAGNAGAAQTSLADAPALGHVADREGTVFLRGALAERWLCAEEGMALAPGDWIKAGARGANAAEVRLADGSRLVLGPGGMLELTAAARLRLLEGELEVAPQPGARIVVAGKGEEATAVEARRIVRSRDGKLSFVEKDPPWLAGYNAKASTEAMGSLLANVDGRNVPLTIGYHRVTADIRDQIARTEVEESFVNNTDSTLEGVFYFPLPQDASISGFAMWIGDEMVEADIVEKERARAIYETILSERRDPGLLEWTGGNIFKARVFPIFPHSEKRIRITYTQVLPKEGDVYRYAYALQSEMLRLTPLRELRIDVKVSSAEAIEAIACPSHPASVRKTDHAAQVELAAQEYRPSRDFELVVRTGPAKERATVLSHVRAGEGYFMVLLAGGAADPGASSRPLDWIIVADTSGSLTDEQIADQRLIVSSLLEALAARDRFRLLAFDATTEWLSTEPAASTPESRSTALDFLERRGALGWSDFEAAFQEAVKHAGKDTQVVYVGDGIPSRGDADPAALAGRLRSLYRGNGVFHAVSVGSTYDLMVLRAIASLGGGSLHRIGGGMDAAQAAGELIREATSSAMREIQLDWQGVRVARVYPEVLPNLPAGRQHIILGRYLPQEGTGCSLRVTGTIGGKKFLADVPVTLAREGEGNSFIPRLWARLHLDHLLEQGSSSGVKEQVIALSEDFQIITPYTSLLVLESDADRERFGVRKRFRMRGGEEFFAEGREAAKGELARQQMLLARGWRLGLRERVLAEYRRLGIEPEGARHAYNRARGMMVTVESRFLDPQEGFAQELGFPTDSAGGGGGGGNLGDEEAESERDGDALAREAGDDASADAAPLEEPLADLNGAKSLELAEKKVGRQAFAEGQYRSRRKLALIDDIALGGREERSAYFRFPEPGEGPAPLSGLFPAPDAPRAPLAPRWPAEVRAVIEALDRRGVVAALDGGFRITAEAGAVDRGRSRPPGRTTCVLSRSDWSVHQQVAPQSFPYHHWLRKDQRGVLDLARGLGAARKAHEGDARSYLEPYPYYFEDLEQRWLEHDASLTRDGARATLKLVARGVPASTAEIDIDLERRIVLEVRTSANGTRTLTQTFGEFQEAAGALWPSRLELRDAQGSLIQVVRMSHVALAPAALETALLAALAGSGDALLLDHPLPALEEAKQRALDGKASFTDRWVLMLHFARTQQWERVREHFEATGKLAAGKSGLEWIRLSLLKASRRNEEARGLILRLAAGLTARASTSPAGEYALAIHLKDSTSGILEGNEMLRLLDALKPIFEKQDARLGAMLAWELSRLGVLDSLGRPEEAFRLREDLARRHAGELGLQTSYIQALAARGELDRALARLEELIATGGPWNDAEKASLREQLGSMLFQHRRLVEYLTYAERWQAQDPASAGAHVWNRYLSSLILLDREAEADAKIQEWLAEPPRPVAAGQAYSRFHAALEHALSQGQDLYANRIEERWRPVLRDLAWRHARDAALGWITGSIATSHAFRNTDEGRALIADLHRALAAELESLPAPVLLSFFGWTSGHAPGPGEAAREDLVKRVFARWEGTREDRNARTILGQIIAAYGNPGQVLALRRLELELAEGEDGKAAAAYALFALLLEQPWSVEAESEALGLVARLGSGPTRPLAQVEVLEALARWLVEARGKFEREAIPGRTKLTRRALRPLEEEARRKAAAEAVKALARLEAAGLDADVRPFVRLERLSIEARLGREPIRVCEELRAILSAIPPRSAADALDGARDILARRCLITHAYIATRRGSPTSLGGETLKLLDDQLAKGDESCIDARQEKYRLLIALDRAAELEQSLAKWAGEAGDVAGNRWRVPLGYVLAELGRLEEAVKAFAGVSARDELGPAEYQALAGWHLALGDRAKEREARVRSHAAGEEWRIQNLLQADLGRHQRRGEAVPEELSAEVFLRFEALFRKSEQPQNHLSLLRGYYEATKDFRLLEVLPAAVLGQTAGKVYPFLEGMGSILDLVGDEATADRIRQHLGGFLERGPPPADRRALSLLAFLVERRAADQANGAGPHIAAAIEAFRAATKEEWSPGEPAWMARLIASLGRLVEPIRVEALRVLADLHERTAAGSDDRLAVAGHRARALHSNGLREEAIQILGGALGEYANTHGGILPSSASQQLAAYVGYLTEGGELIAAERILRRELTLGHNEQHRRWLTIQLYSVLVQALERDAETTLGRGRALHAAAWREIAAALGRRSDENHSNELANQLCALARAAHAKKIAGAGEHLRTFAFQDLPGVLAMYNHRNGQQLVSAVAETLRALLGLREALAFLVTRGENEPRWLARQGSDFWSQHAWRLGQWRSELKEPLGDLEPRLLALVLRGLRQDLRDGMHRARILCDRRHGQFWAEKAGEFFRTAAAVLEERRGSEEGVGHVAEYLYNALGRHEEAIAALRAVVDAGPAGEAIRWQLVEYLQGQKRFAPSLPIVLGLVEEVPLNLSYRLGLLRAYAGVGEREQLESALRAVESSFRELGVWAEQPAWQLGNLCVEVKLPEAAVTYVKEAIELHKKARGGRADAGGTLSMYYGTLAQAYSGLGRTKEAVDAAAGAVVSWGPRLDQRQQALESLARVLRESRDLDAYAAELEREAAEAGLENPTVRKALGRVYAERKDHARAAKHLEVAVEHGPEDPEAQRALVESLDRLGDAGAAAARLLRLGRRKGHDFALFRELGDRWTKLGRPSEAERAYTHLVEASANEAEGRALLAQVREAQSRLPEAEEEWRQVIRIRSREPGGYLGLARVLIAEARVKEAREAIERVLGETWHARFGDVQGEARRLLARLEK